MKYLLIILLIASSIILYAQYYNNTDRWQYEIMDHGFYLGAQKSDLSYSFHILNISQHTGYNIVAGIDCNIYDNIEITALPDSSDNISPVNVPFIMNTVNVYSFSLPIGIIFSRGRMNYGIINHFKYYDMLSDKYFSNEINLFASAQFEYIFIRAGINNATKTVNIASGNLNTYAVPELCLIVKMNILKNDYMCLRGGLQIEAGRNDYADYQMKYWLYGMNREFIIDAEYKRIKGGLKIMGNENALYIGYKTENHYSVYAGVSLGIIKTISLWAKVNI